MERTGVWKFEMNRNRRVDGGRREAEHGKVDHKESSDDEEVELLAHRKGAGGIDLRGGGGGRISVIRRRCQTLSGTNGC